MAPVSVGPDHVEKGGVDGINHYLQVAYSVSEEDEAIDILTFGPIPL